VKEILAMWDTLTTRTKKKKKKKSSELLNRPFFVLEVSIIMFPPQAPKKDKNEPSFTLQHFESDRPSISKRINLPPEEA
jgi:hypothetical protein